MSHRILESCSAVSAAAVLSDFAGTLMVEGYAVNPLLKKRLDPLNAERPNGRGIPVLNWLELACASPTPNVILRPCFAA